MDEQKGLSFDSEGKVFLKVDGETVHINPTSGELELHLNDRRGIGNDSEGLFVKVDGETIVINSEGKLESAFNVNEALEIVTSEGHPVANVRRDNKTIHLNSEHNWLELHPDPQRAFNVDSEGKLYVKFDGDSYPLDSEDSTIILNANGELHVKNYVPNFNDSEKVDKALRVTKDGNDYKLEWRTVSDLDDIALKLSGFETSEGAKYQKRYYYASSEATHIIPDQTPIRYDAATRTVFIDLSSKQNQIGDGILIEDPSVAGNFWLDPDDIYQNLGSEAPATTRLFLSKREKDKLAYKPLQLTDITVNNSEQAVRVNNRVVPYGETVWSSEAGEFVTGNYTRAIEGLKKVAWTGNYLDLTNKVDVRKIYYDVTDSRWKLVDNNTVITVPALTANDKKTPLVLVKASTQTGRDNNVFNVGLRLDNNSIRVSSEGSLYSRGFVLNASEGDVGKALTVIAPSSLTEDATLQWKDSGKVDDVRINNISTVKNKISNIRLDNTLIYRVNTSEFGDSEYRFGADIYAMLPGVAGNSLKALTLDSEGHLIWGEAGKIDKIIVTDGTVSKELDVVDKKVTIRFENGLKVSSEGRIGHVNEVLPQKRVANHILIPAGTDSEGHIVDGTANTVANGLRELTFYDRTNNAGAYVDTTKPWAIIADPTNVTNTTNVTLKIKGFNGTKAAGHKYDDATLKVDADGLSANYVVGKQNILTSETSEALLEIDGNKLKLNKINFLDRLELNEFKKSVIDSEGLNDARYYPTIQLLDTELQAKQNVLDAIFPAVITSEGDSEGADKLLVLYDNQTIILNSEGALKAKDVDLPVYGLLTHLVYPQTSEGNKLVDTDMLQDSIATNLGTFRGNYDSEGTLPTKAQMPAIQRNDYAFVTLPVYDSEGNVEYYYLRYKYIDDTSETGHWQFEYRVSGSTYTVNQLKALNSNWTSSLTNQTITHMGDATIHITAAERTKWNNKQDKLTAGDHINAASLAANTIKVDTQSSIVAATTNDTKIPTIGAIKGYFKKKQTAVDSNSSSTTSEATYFISRIQQDDQGVITPVRTQYTYTNIPNKPQINGVTVEGNKTLAQLGLAAADGVKIDTDGKTVKHTNSITAVTNKQAYKITLDAQGHINTAPELYQPDWNKSYNVRTNTTDSDYIKNAPWVKQGTDANKDAVIISTGTASGTNAVAIAGGSATGEKSIAFGIGTASNEGAIAGAGGVASGVYAVGMAGGTASAQQSTAFGSGSVASGTYSFAAGQGATASGMGSHAEGFGTNASRQYSHAEGRGSQTLSNGNYAHAEGYNTQARSRASHVEGYEPRTGINLAGQHVQGQWNNLTRAESYADIVGWGTSEGDRRNISSLTTTGDLHLAGKVYINSAKDGTGGIELVPDITGKQGYYLAVNAAGTQLEWKEIDLPDAGLAGVTASGGLAATGTTIKDIHHTNNVTAGTVRATIGSGTGGSTLIPKFTYDAQGHLTSKTDNDITIYPPITAGTAKDVWISNGSGRGL